MDIQIAIPLGQRPKAATGGDVLKFMELLRGRGWMKATFIQQITGWDLRTMREWASSSNGEIISGQEGYKLNCEATPEEANHSAERMISQGKDMIRRGIAIRRKHIEYATGWDHS
jgi:hypothetical protein